MGADRLGAKGPTCGTELHIRTGAGKRERLRTTRGVVGHGHGAYQRAFGLGLEGHADRAEGCWIQSGAASIRLSEWSGCSDTPNSQNPEAVVVQRHILSRAGRKDRLVRKSQAGGRERHGGRYAHARKWQRLRATRSVVAYGKGSCQSTGRVGSERNVDRTTSSGIDCRAAGIRLGESASHGDACDGQDSKAGVRKRGAHGRAGGIDRLAWEGQAGGRERRGGRDTHTG